MRTIRKSRAVFIYALLDPDTKEVRYIGKSLNPEARLTQHINEARMSWSPRAEWIKQLSTAGKRPLVEVLETCSEYNWEERERYWIASFQGQLVNGKPGIPSFSMESTAHKSAAITEGTQARLRLLSKHLCMTRVDILTQLVQEKFAQVFGTDSEIDIDMEAIALDTVDYD